MGKRFSRKEVMYDKELSFSYEMKSIIWSGDYEIHEHGEDSDYDYPGDCDTDISITWTNSLLMWDEVREKYQTLLLTKALENEIEQAIKNSL